MWVGREQREARTYISPELGTIAPVTMFPRTQTSPKKPIKSPGT
jgi:hypothetical protein